MCDGLMLSKLLGFSFLYHIVSIFVKLQNPTRRWGIAIGQGGTIPPNSKARTELCNY